MPSVLTGKIIDEGLIGRSMRKLVLFIVLSLSVTLRGKSYRSAGKLHEYLDCTAHYI